jgi:hypothetical protein
LLSSSEESENMRQAPVPSKLGGCRRFGGRHVRGVAVTVGDARCGNGHPMTPGDAFCSQCGQPLAATGAAPPTAPQPPYGSAGFAPPTVSGPPPGAQYQWPGYPATAPPYGFAPAARSRATNGMAIASMVLGIIWIYWVGSVLALVFGYVALRQIRDRDEAGRGMAIAGIVLGWVGVGVAAIVLIIVIVAAATSGS